MSRRLLVSFFESESDILGATKVARECGYKIVDAYTPFAVHGLDEAMGLKPTALPWVCLGFGLAGAASKLWYEFWISVTSWPVNVGGKPLGSLPAFIPVTFEITVLFAGIGTVLGFFLVSRLWFGKRPKIFYDGVTDGQFVLVLEETDAAFDVREIRKLFEPYHVGRMEERVEGESV